MYMYIHTHMCMLHLFLAWAFEGDTVSDEELICVVLNFLIARACNSNRQSASGNGSGDFEGASGEPPNGGGGGSRAAAAAAAAARVGMPAKCSS